MRTGGKESRETDVQLLSTEKIWKQVNRTLVEPATSNSNLAVSRKGSESGDSQKQVNRTLVESATTNSNLAVSRKGSESGDSQKQVNKTLVQIWETKQLNL